MNCKLCGEETLQPEGICMDCSRRAKMQRIVLWIRANVGGDISFHELVGYQIRRGSSCRGRVG